MEDEIKRRQKIVEQWKAIAKTYPAAIDDLFKYADGQREMVRRWGEERAIYEAPIDNDTIASLLQQGRGCNMIVSYIKSMIDSDVAQPTKSK